MDKYTASNGVPIRRTAKGYLSFTDMDLGTLAGITVDQEVALRELFQAERDEELGRWRYPKDPQFVVYGGYSPGEDSRVARVVHEHIGTSTIVYEKPGVGRTSHPAASAYFEAHPERMPWDSAQRDEVWLFKSSGNGRALAWRAEDGWDVIDQVGNYHRGIEDVPAEMRAHSFYGWENPTAVRMESRSDV